MIDLLVAGGGPAGLATALLAARAGLEVEVWEPRPGAVDKACGEGLMPGALRALQDLGLDPAGQDLTGIRYLAGSRRAQAAFRAGPGRGVRRTVLHAALREGAVAAGVRVVPRAAGVVRQDDAAVHLDGVAARYLVAADGLHSPVRRQLGLDAGTGRLRRFGQRRHFALAPWTSFVEVHWAPTAEAYVTPVAADRVGVAVLSGRRGTYEEQLAAFPQLRERLAGGEPAGPVRGAGPLRRRVRARTAGRVLLVGDAAGYVDALTGEGVALALAQASAAVTALRDGVPQRYEQDWRRLTRRYRWLTAGLVQATRVPVVRRGLVPTAERVPVAFASAVNALAGPAQAGHCSG
ncbi:NAD(P)/FAD-dependent oxidoreductase [Nocardioides pantholopis]|uniref:NAD(P)/FAD-dependent oxidoreductase n=1 Tax=Nocardioides pantholopis TaxID=2483798 RepID=UPI000F098C21|nr:NAD(P)/FAD-dependent oxidoreductase [Nocardioides pantholopis]